MSFESNLSNLNFRSGTLQGNLWIKPVASYYSAAQIVQWLTCIKYTPCSTGGKISDGHFPAGLDNLATIMRLHLATFPFENTAMHYTADHSVDVSPQGLYQNFIMHHKGSYCFGQNTLFLEMLRGMGYRAYGGAARVNLAPPKSNTFDFAPLSHLVIFVQPIANSNATYLADVGFGGLGLSQPILLADDQIVWGSAPPERHRLTRGAHPSSSLESKQGLNDSPGLDWRLEVTRDFENPTWSTLYAFSENEFFTADIENASFAVSKRPGATIFWNDVLISKRFILGDDDNETVNKNIPPTCQGTGLGTGILRGNGTWLGSYTMAKGIAKRNVGDQSVVIKESKNELERLHVMREVFGIRVEDSDLEYIEGRDAALTLRA